jgi:hypothetical protein
MKHINIENIYHAITLLSDTDRNRLYDRMKRDFYQDSEIVAYTTNGKALTCEQYKKRVHFGIEQCERGESISLEDLSLELGYNYADL